jgi:hypothetical protein
MFEELSENELYTLGQFMERAWGKAEPNSEWSEELNDIAWDIAETYEWKVLDNGNYDHMRD